MKLVQKFKQGDIFQVVCLRKLHNQNLNKQFFFPWPMFTQRKNRCVLHLQLAKTIQGFLEALLIIRLTGKNFITECFVSGVMGLLLLRLGYAGLLALMLIQGFLLAAYPAKYKDEPRWYALVCSYAPAITVCLFNKAFLRRLVFVWILYMFCGLVPNIAIVLGFVGDSLDNNRFLGPITLKTALCLTPPILLLLVNTASDSNENRETVSKLSFRMTLNLFDSVDMIDIVLDTKEHVYEFQKNLVKP